MRPRRVADADNRAMRLAPTALPLLFIAALIAPRADAQWLSWPPKATPPAASPEAEAPATAVRLRITRTGGTREIRVDSDIAGPVEVRVEGASPTPLQRTLPAPGSYPLARRDAGATLQLKLLAVPGKPGAMARDVVYHFPLRLPQVRVGQLPEGTFSHADAENRQAIDFAAPIGTPVVAARAGTVMQAEGRFADTTTGRLDEANLVRILHDDGSMAVYAHLQHGSLSVAPGQQVEAGQPIARSGNSGLSTGPHLHFAVQVNRGLRLESVPFRMATEQGELRLPRRLEAPSPL